VSRRQEICVLQGHTACVESVVFSPKGQQLASGSSDQGIFVWQCVGEDITAWRLIARFTRSPCLIVAQAFFKGAQLSSNNLALLKQRGANDKETPVYPNNPYSFWTQKALTSAPPPLPAYQRKLLPPLTSPILHEDTNFEKAVLNCVNTLQGILHNLGEYDVNAATSFTATFLRALRKDSLNALQASPENGGLPRDTLQFFMEHLAENPLLNQAKTLPDRSRDIENALLRGELSELKERYYPVEVVQSKKPLEPHPSTTHPLRPESISEEQNTRKESSQNCVIS